MSIWGGITGGLLGFVVLGPIGALVGSVIGSNLSSRSKRRKPNNFDQQVAFFAALFACLAKIAKADGRVDEAEIKKIEEIISIKLNLNKEHRHFAINIFHPIKIIFVTTIVIFHILIKLCHYSLSIFLIIVNLFMTKTRLFIVNNEIISYYFLKDPILANFSSSKLFHLMKIFIVFSF